MDTGSSRCWAPVLILWIQSRDGLAIHLSIAMLEQLPTKVNCVVHLLWFLPTILGTGHLFFFFAYLRPCYSLICGEELLMVN